MNLPATLAEHPQAARTPAPAAGRDAAGFLRAVREAVADWAPDIVSQAAADLAAADLRLAVGSDREHTLPALALLQGQREAVTASIVRALQRQLDAGSAAPPAAAGPSPAGGELRLIDESQIDEDIEVARIVQAIESDGGAEWHRLTGLCSSLRGLDAITPDAAPLPPLACAGALRAALVELSPAPGLRLFLLRRLGTALGRRLRQVHAGQAELLRSWGLAAAPYRIKAQAAPRSASPRVQDKVRATSQAAPEASEALRRLLEFARAVVPAGAPASGSTTGGELRLFADPLPGQGASASAPDPDAAGMVMDRLFEQIERQLQLSPPARAMLGSLRGPARTLAGSDSQIWSSPQHPWWVLLDRLISLGSVHDDAECGGDGPVTRSLEQIAERLRKAPVLDRAACLAAVADVQQAAEQQLGQRRAELVSQVGALQTEADRDGLEVDLRQQIVHQLRSTPTCLALRRFLVGPWTQAIAQTGARHGLGSPLLETMALVVDDLIRATARPGHAVSRAQRAVLLRQVADGLERSGLPAPRCELELIELQALLRCPPPIEHHAADWDGADEQESGARADARQLDLQAGLPTVPICMDPDISSTLEAEHHAPWVDSLVPGRRCRLFLLGRWLTAQLSWVSPTRNLFLFTSRHAGRTHSLTRRMLEKLRRAGLATTIDDGMLLAMAMQRVTEAAPL